MLGSSESEAAIDKLETELTKPEPELKTASSAEVFAPAVKEALEPKLDEVSGEPEDSAATLRASAIPAFGGLSKQPFAGIEPTNNGKRGLIIGGLVVGLAAAGFAGAGSMLRVSGKRFSGSTLEFMARSTLLRRSLQ